MSQAMRSVVVLSCLFVVGSGRLHAEPSKPVQPAMDPKQHAAMEAMQQAGSPSEGHKALVPFVGTWRYEAEWRMSPEAPAQSMTGTATNTLVFGGRFLKQEVRGEVEGEPPFEGIGYTGYDNVRKEYPSVWFDNRSTGIMTGAGVFDAATRTITERGEFSCPMTGEAHRQYRAIWKVLDADHTTYESYMRAPDGREFKSMELHYTRAS